MPTNCRTKSWQTKQAPLPLPHQRGKKRKDWHEPESLRFEQSEHCTDQAKPRDSHLSQLQAPQTTHLDKQQVKPWLVWIFVKGKNDPHAYTISPTQDGSQQSQPQELRDKVLRKQERTKGGKQKRELGPIPSPKTGPAQRADM